MIHRIVKLNFTASYISEFESKFSAIKKRVINQNGCIDVSLLKGSEHTYFTYSLWESKADLETYRSSSTFKEIWSLLKPNFTAKPEAWSTKKIA